MKITISSEDGTVIDVSEQYTVTVQLPNSSKPYVIADDEIDSAYKEWIEVSDYCPNKSLKSAFFSGAKFIINGSNKHGQWRILT